MPTQMPTHAYTHAYIHVHRHAYTHAYAHVYIHVYTCVYTHVWTHVCTHVHTQGAVDRPYLLALGDQCCTAHGCTGAHGFSLSSQIVFINFGFIYRFKIADRPVAPKPQYLPSFSNFGSAGHEHHLYVSLELRWSYVRVQCRDGGRQPSDPLAYLQPFACTLPIQLPMAPEPLMDL